VLELQAEAELVRPSDVHLHLVDPSRYVDGAGRVDRAAIRTDLQQLVAEQPELSRYGHGPGQEPYRPDERRRPAPGGSVGARGPAHSTASAVGDVLEMMRTGGRG